MGVVGLGRGFIGDLQLRAGKPKPILAIRGASREARLAFVDAALAHA